MKQKTKQDIPVLILLGAMVVFFITFLASETTLIDKEEKYTHSFEAAVDAQAKSSTQDVKLEDSGAAEADEEDIDRKSTRLNSSHVAISYAVFCLKKTTKRHMTQTRK